MDPQTTGLWIWAKFHPRDPENVVIMMDTEGLDSPHIPQWYNWTLSALAILISSYFIYQTKGSIDSNSVDRLGAILKVAEQLSGGERDDTTKPNFMWLIRDHQLAMKQEPREEMASKMDRHDLELLRRCFHNYDCFPLPRPVSKDELLPEVESLSWEELKPEFREEYAILERQILSAVAKPHVLSGRTITGEVIGDLVEKYSEAINSKDGVMTSLSQLPTQRQMVVRMAGERALREGLRAYSDSFSEIRSKFPVDQSDLGTVHENAEKTAIENFNKEVMAKEGQKLDSDLQKILDIMLDQIARWSDSPSYSGKDCTLVKKLVGGIYHDVWKENVRISEEKCREISEKLSRPIVSKLNSFESIAEYKQQIDQFKRDYQKEAVGVAKGDVLKETLREFDENSNTVRDSLVRKEIEEISSKSREEIQTLRSELEKSKETLGNLMENQQKTLQTRLEEISANLLEKFRSESAQISTNLSALETVTMTKLESVENKTTDKLNQMENRIKETKTEVETKLESNLKSVNELNSQLKERVKKKCIR
eukprot:TRINITY_DN11346_c0_g1_i1.p1 TRINITY_DN11346_c0_g1~~TRINITY_DN11346_c0_g1_i1.p1  ORF type:complete len:538 (-),score=148.97 TRINITY_DN11346_c0_g1_i1:39-1652(-)